MHLFSVKRQCELLDIHRSGLYYQPSQESELNLELMRKIDKEYLLHPFYGVPKMWDYIRNTLRYEVSYNRIERLYRIMNLRAICPIPYTSKSNPQHKKYPYLLKDLSIERSNQVWATDITYIPMKKGFMYLMAILDLYSRDVLNWSVSNSMESEWCATVLQEAITQYGKPEIINSDQGSQFTSEHWINACNNIKISMDGKGRALANESVCSIPKLKEIKLHQ
jgi:putative transposase